MPSSVQPSSAAAQKVQTDVKAVDEDRHWFESAKTQPKVDAATVDTHAQKTERDWEAFQGDAAGLQNSSDPQDKLAANNAYTRALGSFDSTQADLKQLLGGPLSEGLQKGDSTAVDVRRQTQSIIDQGNAAAQHSGQTTHMTSGGTESINSLTQAPPQQPINLSTWLLNDPSKGAQEVTNKQLLSGYNSPNFSQNQDGSLTFTASSGGPRTAHSQNSRSELAEVSPRGDFTNYALASGNAQLNGTLAVNQTVPGGVMVAQYKGRATGSDPAGHPMAYITYKDGTVSAHAHTDPSTPGVQVTPLLTNVPLNQPFSYQIHTAPNGTVSFSANSNGQQGSVTKTVSPNWNNGAKLHFQAGCYNQGENTQGANTSQGRVTYYNLAASHTP